MKSVSITEAKNGLSALLDQVRAGETIVITDRGVPVARLEPAAGKGDDEEGRVARLERKGIIRRGKGGISEEILKPPPGGGPAFSTHSWRSGGRAAEVLGRVGAGAAARGGIP